MGIATNTFYQLMVLLLVKVVGVEPTSESISVRISPSAADCLLFRKRDRQFGRLNHFLSRSSPVLPGDHTEFSCIMTPGFGPTGESEPTTRR